MRRALLIILTMLTTFSCSILSKPKEQRVFSSVEAQTNFLGCTYGDSYETVESIMNKNNYGSHFFNTDKTLIMVKDVKFAGIDWESAIFFFDSKKELEGVTFKTENLEIYDTLLFKLKIRYGEDNLRTMDDGTLVIMDGKGHTVRLSKNEKDIRLSYSDLARFWKSERNKISEL